MRPADGRAHSSTVVQELQIRAATLADAASIARIYNHYVRDTVVTFEEQEVSSEQMSARLAAIAAASMPWLLAERAGTIVGYAYADKWKRRSAYRHSAETTIYLDPVHIGAGVGRRLYGHLLDRLQDSAHVVISGIALPNVASVALHENFGFVKVAHFKEVGFKFGRWIDVGYWQKALEI